MPLAHATQESRKDLTYKTPFQAIAQYIALQTSFETGPCAPPATVLIAAAARAKEAFWLRNATPPVRLYTTRVVGACLWACS